MKELKPFRYSKQREKILELLKDSKSHPSADVVYEKMKESFPSISLGTVYRNLGVLHEQGLINRIMHTGSADRFDADMYDHSHFYCQKCGAIYDVASVFQAEEATYTTDGHRINRQTTSYYGFCRSCIKLSQQ